MKRSCALSIFLLSLAAVNLAQSGRRVAATPTPTPRDTLLSVPENSAPMFSESKPLPPRNIKPPTWTQPVQPIDAPKPSQTAATDDEESLKVETDLITIPVSVFDRDGLYISGLKKENFSIFEDGKPQQIAYFGTTDRPFTVILLIDTSPSTEFSIDQIRQAATAFVDLLKPEDSVMVIEFDANVHVLTEATNDRQKIYKAIKRADFGGGTSLYDAVDFSIKKRLNKVQGRKAIVLFTDGVDTTSTRSGYDSSIDLAEESDALIFPIYYNTYGRTNNRSGWPGLGGVIYDTRGTRPEDYALGRKYLEDLASYTGGRVFRSESTPGGLSNAFAGIAEELRRQYNIGYTPDSEGKPGQRKQIRVRVDRPGLIIRARDSYIVGQKSN